MVHKYFFVILFVIFFQHEAELIALACSNAPSGKTRWTLELLKEKLKREKGFKIINRESIWLMLKKTNVNLG